MGGEPHRLGTDSPSQGTRGAISILCPLHHRHGEEKEHGEASVGLSCVPKLEPGKAHPPKGRWGSLLFPHVQLSAQTSLCTWAQAGRAQRDKGTQMQADCDTECHVPSCARRVHP